MLTLFYLLPIFCMLVCLLVLKLSAVKASAISFFVTLMIFTFYFRAGIIGTVITIAKGSSLALFVILIIWGAMLLYNLVNETKALGVINRNIEIAIDDKFYQFILLSWVFAPFLQGIAGFGVPVFVVASILASLGFDPVKSACAVLVGHSWAISFGSMGSSIFAIDMVTHSPISEIIVDMSLFGAIAMFCTGLGVCFIHGGIKDVVKGFPFVLFISTVMSVALYFFANVEMLSVIGLLAALTGFVAGVCVLRIRSKEKQAVRLYSAELNLFQAILPYLLAVTLSVSFFLLNPQLSIDLSFAGYETLLGHVVPYEENYVSFNVLRFPLTVILMSSLISVVVFYKKRTFNLQVAKSVLTKTVAKCIPTSVTILFLLCMAVMMIDSGMIEQIAISIALVTGNAYPLISPFIGLLGAFIAGGNTNSNIIFGSLQEIAAGAIGVNAVRMCAVQSIGASVGAALGPTMVALGAAAAQTHGSESQIYRKILGPIFITVLMLGIANFIMI